ncbi:metallopeptidase TldD-related protein [Labilibacter marinus]|uniref:metallopeptidase TldD-related protein n=1 Tax=Labilibacter marinus TaxID=1477105 RepID=UPI000950167B|nr:metallopeptidase TldD-related protein [Labilibacter marinus]
MHKIIILSIIILSVITNTVWAQKSNAYIIKKALQDELSRGMDSIAANEIEKPCFMSFTIIDGEISYIAASLGALIGSNTSPALTYSSRLIVGDYHMNDENFNYNESRDYKYNQEIRMPRKVDYWGIRRALWSSTERMYENASKSYKAKKAFLEDNNLTKEDYVLPDYSAAPVVNMELPQKQLEVDLPYWEDAARRISAVFVDYPEITTSNTEFSFMQSTSYFINSEGTSYTYPNTLVNIDIQAALNDTINNTVQKSISYTGLSIDDIPSVDSLMQASHQLVQLLKDEKEREALKEAYNGPILFEGLAASELLLNTFFSYNGLIAQREALNYQGYDFRLPTEPESNSMEAKIGKKVVAESITVKSLSNLKNYNNKKLWGAFEIDGEGVVPPEELTLIEDGILKTLLNDRVPSFGVKESNGHNRINSLWGNQVFPGVLKIESNEAIAKNKMKDELIALAKENENDYCFIVRESEELNDQFVYQVNVNTGEEKLISTGRVSNVKMKDLKKKVIFSDNEEAYNITRGTMLSSVISPDAIIVKDMDISAIRPGRKNKAAVVASPLVKN